MTETPETLVPVYLRRIDGNVQELRGDMREVRTRLTRVEAELARLVRDRGDDLEARAHLQAQLDRLREEMERIKRRLDIAE